MWVIGWRSIAAGFVFLLDLVAFADLVRTEFSDARARRVAFRRGHVPTTGHHPSRTLVVTRSAGTNPSVTSTILPLTRLACRDDLEIARRRMKHLAPWHVVPMPMTQQASSELTARPAEKPANYNPSLFQSHAPMTFQRHVALDLAAELKVQAAAVEPHAETSVRAMMLIYRGDALGMDDLCEILEAIAQQSDRCMVLARWDDGDTMSYVITRGDAPVARSPAVEPIVLASPDGEFIAVRADEQIEALCETS
jgi:hypothetical protein